MAATSSVQAASRAAVYMQYAPLVYARKRAALSKSRVCAILAQLRTAAIFNLTVQIAGGAAMIASLPTSTAGPAHVLKEGVLLELVLRPRQPLHIALPARDLYVWTRLRTPPTADLVTGIVMLSPRVTLLERFTVLPPAAAASTARLTTTMMDSI